MEGITLNQFLIIGAVMFSAGILTVVLKRNLIAMLMGIELMLNAANLNLVAFAYYKPSRHALSYEGQMLNPVQQVLHYDGQVFAIFVIIMAAAEAAVALALVFSIFNLYRSVDVSKIDTLKG